jgi:hypothetical protein
LNVVDTSKDSNFNSDRMVMAAWILACFIISGGYSGTLRAFLTSPSFEESIATFSDLLDSGLPWDKVSYGDYVDAYMATTDDPVIKRIWDGKEDSMYGSKFLQARVRGVR